MRRTAFTFIVIATLLGAGCSRDAAASAFMKDYAQACDEIAARFKADDLEGAQESFDDRKPKLAAEWDKIRTGLPFQYSDGIKKRMKSDPEASVGEVVQAANEYVKRHPKDEAKAQAIALGLANIFR